MREIQMKEISLSDAIRRIQEELIDSELERVRRGAPPLFQLKSMELEMQVVVKQTESTKGGIDFKIVSLQSVDDIATEAVHKVRISFDVASGAITESLPGVFPHRT